MSDYIFENTGLEPYVMTNGKLLSANKECELREYCTLLKWVWFNTTVCNEGEKLQDYCLMKKALVRGYFHALYDDELREAIC